MHPTTEKLSRLAHARGIASWLGLCAALLVAGPRPAAACGGPYCVEGEFFPARGTVPANLPAVLFWPLASWDSGEDGGAGPDRVEPGDVRFVRLDPSGPVDVAFELMASDEPSTRRWAGSHGAPAYRIVPAAELQPGARYALWARSCDGEIADEPPSPIDAGMGEVEERRPPYAFFEAVDAAALPSSLGSVILSDAARRDVTIGGGAGCYDVFESATVTAEVQGSAEPFFHAIAFTTYVDDEVYRPSQHLNIAPPYGSSWLGHGRDELVSVCAGQDMSGPLAFGRHTLRFEGRVAGTDRVLATQTVDFELPPCSVSTDGGAVETTDGGTGADAAVEPDAGRTDADASSVEPDAGMNASADAADGDDEPSGRNEGCGGCATTGDARGTALPILLALGFLRARRQRPRGA